MPGRRPGHAGQEVVHLAPGAALGEAFEEGAAGIHHRDDRRRERLAEDERRRHGQRGDDIEARPRRAPMLRRISTTSAASAGTTPAIQMRFAMSGWPAK